MMRVLFFAKFRLKALIPWLVLAFLLGGAAVLFYTAPAIDYLSYPLEEMPELFTAFGFVGNSNLPQTIRSYLYGFVMPLLLGLYAVSASRRLVARPKMDGRLAMLLAAPVHRSAVLMTLWLAGQASVVLIVLIALMGQIIMTLLLFPGADLMSLTRLALGFMPVASLAASLCFLLSAASNDERLYLRRARLLLFVMLGMTMAARLPRWTRALRLVSFWSLFNGNLALDAAAWLGALAAGILSLACLALSLVLFKREEF